MSIKVISLVVGLGIVSSLMASEQNSYQLDGIIVTGEKQQRNLKNTTSSVSIIDSEKFTTNQYQRLVDVVAEVPNIVTNSGLAPDIRGVTGNGASGGFNGVSGGANARISSLIDGVAQPFVAEYTGDIGLWDIDQIEVYRGPQSTNNGRNSIGGSIYVTTKDPSFDWQGAVRLGYRNKDSYFDKAIMLSGPVIQDKLAFRFSGQRLDAQTTSNDAEFATNPASFDLNELESKRGRIKLLFTPTDDLDVLFSYSRNKEQGDTGRRYFELAKPYDYKRSFINDTKTETDTFSLKLKYRFSDSMSVDFLLADLGYKYGFDSYQPIAVTQQQVLIEEDTVTLDTKFNFGDNSPRLHGFIGFAYYDRKQDILGQGAFTYYGDDELDSKAIYSEINFAVSDQFSITAGLRYQDEDQNRKFALPPRISIYARLDESNKIFLPKLVFNYDVNKLNRISLSARKGYNSSGGALNFFSGDYYFYDEEKVNTYELSSYSDLLEGKLNLRTNLFYNDYDGYQGQNSLRRIVNIDKVTTYGLEVEATALVTADLQITFALGLLKTKVKKAGDQFIGIDGHELNSAPKKTANIAAKYYLNDTWNVGANLQYIGGYYGDVENTRARKIGGYSLANLTASYESGPWLVSAFINNVFDKEALRAREPVGRGFPVGFADIVERRNMGISATYSFF